MLTDEQKTRLFLKRNTQALMGVQSKDDYSLLVLARKHRENTEQLDNVINNVDVYEKKRKQLAPGEGRAPRPELSIENALRQSASYKAR